MRLRNAGYSIQRLRKVFKGLRSAIKQLPTKVSLMDLTLFFWRDEPPAILVGEVYGQFPDKFCTVVRISEVISSDVNESDRPGPDAEVPEGVGGGTG
jgi:hypothetical protein